MALMRNREFWAKWGAVSIIAPLIIALAFFCYWSVERNKADVETLDRVDLPLLKSIQQLRTALLGCESAVYEYYLTTEAEYFSERFNRQTEQVQESISAITAALGDSLELRMLKEVSLDIQQTTKEFETVMAQKAVDWDAAREVLSRFSPLTTRAASDSEALRETVQARVLERSQAYARRVEQTLYLVATMVAMAAIAAAWLARSNLARVLALKEQERLASFPSSNPHPVMALDLSGNIIYANHAAHSIAPDGELTELLPQDLTARLTRSSAYSEWEFEKQGRTFQINLGFLSEHNEYHVYLSEITQRKKVEQDLEYLAYHDATTGLIKREQFNGFVDRYLGDEHEALILVAMMDIELLDRVFSVAGVSVSEKVASIAAKRLQQAISEDGALEHSCLSYLGGGLFCFAYPNNMAEAELIFRRMQEAISIPFDVDSFEFYLNLSIGVAIGEDINLCASEEALRLADGALQQAKSKRAGLIAYYEPAIEAQHQYRLLIEQGLRYAIERDQLRVYYQPKISLKTRRVEGVEALVRWQHPDLDFVSPADFIPVAEKSGQVLEIGQWVLEQACEDMEAWNTGRKNPVSVAVNLSAKQLLYSDISAQVLNVSRRFDVPVSWIELEITETAALSDFERALEKLKQLDTLGVKLSLDDFGTGFSSLSYLQQLPVSALKIDRSFVASISADASDRTLTNSIIKMAQQLNLEVIAEGVETKEQLGLLNRWGCDYVQGYYLAKPMPISGFMQFLHKFDIQSSTSDDLSS